MGFHNAQYVAIRTPTPRIVRGLEQEHGLTRVTPSRDVEKRAPKQSEIQLASQGVPSVRHQLQGMVDAAAKGNPGMTHFLGRLDAAGVQAIPNIATTGNVSGITYMLGNEPMK